MATLAHARRSSSQLLHTVLDRPELLAAVRELPASTLVRLIHQVGLEDAGELIALTSTEQLAQVFDAELWRAAEPGADELFDPARFALYLRLMFEAGDAFVVERLLALPRALLTLAFHRLLLVIDIDALTVRFGSAGKYFDDGMDRVIRAIDHAQFEEWEEFRLIARDTSAFDDVWNAFLLIDREDHALARMLMERCCDLDGELIEESGLYAVLNEEQVLENDLAAERADRRAAAGFVAPADARAFLELARRGLRNASPDGHDAITRAYLRSQSYAPVVQAPPDATREVHRLLSDIDGNAEAGAPVVRRERSRLSSIAQAMRALHVLDSALHTARSHELMFLANVLIAGSRHAGRAFRPVEALECALATCSVGLYCMHLRATGSRRTPSLEAWLELLQVHTADALFRAGSRALQRAVVKPAQALLSRGCRVPEHAAALAALAESEPWLGGSLAVSGRLFIDSASDVRRALRLLERLSTG